MNPSKTIKIFLLVLIFTLANKVNSQTTNMPMKMDKSSADTSIVRKGVINLKSIDKNNDGKIFQCPMDLNVLADEKMSCPECGMNLREIKIDDAKAKLLKKGFKLSESGENDGMKNADQKTAEAKAIWNKVCPVMGEDVDPDAPTVEYQGKTIGFCCKGCEKKFKADPEKYMKNLTEDGAKFLKKS